MLTAMLIAAAIASPLPASAPIAEPELILRTDAGDCILTVEEYVARCVAAEVPYTFAPEALKAQAVAARTYLAHCIETGSRRHDGADVCTDASHCCGYAVTVPPEIAAAVDATAGEILTLDGAPILAMWHASSAGMTASCGEILAEVPYLAAVSTPETPERSRAAFTRAETARIFADAGYYYNRKETIAAVPTASGRCASLTLGNVTLTGREVRRLFGLKSTDFVVKWERGMLVFDVYGYGHGIGMSQRGAQTMADAGASYTEILAHYYSGDEIAVERWEIRA